MAAFLNLVRLVTGMGDSDPNTSSPGRSFTKWEFVEVEDEKGADEAKCREGVYNTSFDGADEFSSSKVVCSDSQIEPKSEVTEVMVVAGRSSEGDGPVSHTKRTKNQKKKDKKKTRNRSNSTVSTDSVASSSVSSKSVSWGVVEEVLFSRDQGLGSVPSSGLFPLGFGAEEGKEETSVDQHVSHSQVKLIERAHTLGLSLSSADPSTSSSVDYSMLETRQFDYRRGKNPLFHSLTEEERILLLGNTARPRSRSRSGSFSRGGDDGGMTVHSVNDSNKELLDIRSSRLVSPGCLCKAVKVDKLSVTKLKHELILHKDKVDKSVDEINALSKTDLIFAVRSVLQSCPLCVSNSCSCVKEGIGCHHEVCSCFKHNNLQVCANEFNEAGYSGSKVDEYRRKYITAKPITTGGISGGNTCSGSNTSRSSSSSSRRRSARTSSF